MDEELVLKTSGCKRFGGSIPFASANTSLAQLVEQWSPKPKVVGSIPARCANGTVDELV